MSHDGYRSLYGIIHRRRLWLSADGGDLRGEDMFTGPEGRPVTVPDRRFIVRFHLHPTVKATLAQSGQAVLMRLPSGRGWRLRASGRRHRPGRKHLSRRGRPPCAAPSRSCWSARFPPKAPR